MIKLLKLQHGVTLPEILLALSISSVVGVLLISLFVQNTSLFSSQNAKTNQGLDLNNTFTKISADIRAASSIATAYPAVNPQYTSGANTLVLAWPSIDASGNVISSTYDYLVITKDTQNPKILREKLYPNGLSHRILSDKVMVKDLSQVTFSYLDINKNPTSPNTAVIVNFIVNLSTSAGNKTQTSTSSGQVSLRNN